MIDRINQIARKVPAWPLYILSILWAAYLFYLGLTGGLGVEPINALEREYGEVALKLLVLGLAITPLRKHVGLNLLKFRRAIGLSAFFFVVAHFGVWALLDVQSMDRVVADILKRPYVTIGMVGLVLLVPLAVTSNNLSIRRLGAKWRKLHLLTYPAVALGALHYVWLAKGFQLEPLIYAVVIGVLLALRWKTPSFRQRQGA
jgi:sulfoxide reductase heme-binding subunit YedZ